MGTQLSLLNIGGRAPQFSAHVYYGQTAGWIKMRLDTEVGHGPGHIVLDGDPAPPKRLDASRCRALGVQVGIGPGHIVLGWAQLPPKKARPQFSAHVYCGQTVANLSYCRTLVTYPTCIWRPVVGDSV